MQHPQAEAFEDGMDLQIGLLEAFVPDPGASWSGYPFPELKPTGEQEMRTFRTIILENPYLRAVVVPGLGGRILSILDKRTDTEILRRHPMIEPQSGGRRGAFVREGVHLWLDGEERLNALGNVATQIEHAPDDESDVAVWVAETFTGTGLSFHLRISLPPHRAELKIEARVLNRTLRPQPYNGGLAVYLGEGEFDGSAFYSPERNAGLAIFADDQVFDGVGFEDGVVHFARFAEVRELAPRQVDTWNLSLVPLSGLGVCAGASREAAASIRDGELHVQVTEQRMGHKLLILTHDAQTLEAAVDLYPENVFDISLGDLKPLAVALRNPGKEEIFRIDTSEPRIPTKGRPSKATPAPTLQRLNFSTLTSDLRRATFDISSRHLAHSLLAIRALNKKRYLDASASFEQALMFNAEDPLLWWGKVVSHRLGDQDNEAELLNAHFLSPLEPALRAESFLSQPISLDVDPNPLLAPLAENPEEFIEVACLLIECGLFDQASRWIDEALRHRELAMLRYLMAYCLLTATRLNAEASEQIRLASLIPFGPPFPFRDIERKALAGLIQVFPDDKNLSRLLQMTVE